MKPKKIISPESSADRIFNLAIENSEVFKDQNGECYIVFGIEVTNIIDYSDTVTFSKVKKFYIVCPEAEQALSECVELLIERKKNSNKQS